MPHLLLESDAILRILPAIVDPATKAEHVAAVADFFRHDEPDFLGWRERLRGELAGLYPADVVFAEDQAELRAKIAEADAVIVEGLEIGEAELAAAPRLKLVQKFGRVTTNIDRARCAKRGIPVATLRRRVNIAVAEQAFALILALDKRIPELNGIVAEEALRAAGYDPRPFDRRYTGNSNFARIPGLGTLAGATLGLVGLGEIGREIAVRARPFEMEVLYTQRHPLDADAEAALGVRYAALPELLRRSDHISIQLPLTPATRGFLDRAALAHLKPGASLVNSSRAELVDHAALLEALDSGRLRTFALDVGYSEPARPDEPLLRYPRGRVILMPHTAVAHRRNGLDDMAGLCRSLLAGLRETP